MSGWRWKPRVLGFAMAWAALAAAGAAAEDAAPIVRPDRIPAQSSIVRFDGTSGAPAADRAAWLQMAFEVRGASDTPADFPDPADLRARAVSVSRAGSVPLALLNVRFGAAPGSGPAFAAAALDERTLRGGRVVFRLERSEYLTNDPRDPRVLAFDPGDGRGFRPLVFGGSVEARYASVGEKTARVRMTFDDGEALEAAFTFEVAALVAPDPDDTLHVTAAEPWQGAFGTGRAYIYRAPGHAALERPAIVVEGFDLDNTMDWDVLYELLNRENLLEDLRAEGFDLVVLDFTDATVPIQENALVLESLIAEVASAVPGTPIPLVGASMGGLVARRALARLESTGAGHPVSTFISFDTPHLGANIPLGIQYWLWFFADQSADAAYLLTRLDRPAARQMLVYHYTDPPGTTGQADPLRAGWLADLAAVGNWPSQPRLVAVANGSGSAVGQGFGAGDPIVRYRYSGFLTNIVGDVWAVPDAAADTIFNGRFQVVFPDTRETVIVSGTAPYDNAPGGTRATMAEMDAASVPLGDVVALHDSHCFIPTVSALAWDVPDLFDDVAAAPDPLAHTPFDAIYYPGVNEEHVAVTAQNAAWLRAEIEAAVTAVGPLAEAARPALDPAAPNPFAAHARIGFTLPAGGQARVAIHDVSGRRVRALVSGWTAAGRHRVEWDGRDDAGRQVSPGLYFVRLTTPLAEAATRLVRVR